MSYRDSMNRFFRVNQRPVAGTKFETAEEFLARGGKVDRQPEGERRDFSRHARGNAIYENDARRRAAENEARELAKPESTP